MKIIGIAGGSGTGKSTVSYALIDGDPARFEVLNLDDYHKPNDTPDLPRMDGIINWDHPDVVDWEQLVRDIKTLKAGGTVTLQTWAHRSNPDYAQHHRRISRLVRPHPVLIVEGYLALYDPRVTEFYDRSYYLDLDEATRNIRRDKESVIAQDNYLERIGNPTHNMYVEPTKKNADVVIDVSGQSVEKVCQRIQQTLNE